LRRTRLCTEPAAAVDEPDETGSIIVLVATDAPLLPHQLKRVARRVELGMARLGAAGYNYSGDIFLAFSTANRAGAAATASVVELELLPNDLIDPVFEAAAQATEEAILNAMLAAEPVVGPNGLRFNSLPAERLVDILQAKGVELVPR
jgi:L-aminopeptidase/D-esterase-like protein